MTIAAIGIAKGLAIAAGVTGSVVAAAHMGNLVGLTNAVNHVPTWTHAHSVITSLMQKR
ncbi:MAG: hypothetical protein ACP5UZ_08505 [Thermoplasmata archaeon]